MTDYNVIAEVGVTLTAKRADAWIDASAPYSPAVGSTDRGQSELIITIPAKSLEQAVKTGFAVMTHAAGQLERFEVLTTAEFDRRVDDVDMPELIGATEAAELLRVSRQRIQQLAAGGSIPSQKIGKSLVLPRATVEAMAARDGGADAVGAGT